MLSRSIMVITSIALLSLLIPTAGLLWVSFPQCCHTCPGSIATDCRMNHTDKHGEWRPVAVHLFKVNDSMLLKGRDFFDQRPSVPHALTFHDNDLGILGQCSLWLSWCSGPSLCIIAGLETVLWIRKESRDEHSSGRQTTRAHATSTVMSAAVLYNSLISFPGGLTKLSWILAKTRGSASGIGKVTGAKSPAAADLSPETVQTGVLTHRWTPPQTVGRSPCPRGRQPISLKKSGQWAHFTLLSQRVLLQMELMFLPPGF